MVSEHCKWTELYVALLLNKLRVNRFLRSDEVLSSSFYSLASQGRYHVWYAMNSIVVRRVPTRSHRVFYKSSSFHIGSFLAVVECPS